MSLTNTGNASNIKSFVAVCYPKEYVNISTVYSGNVKSADYVNYIESISIVGATTTEKTSIAALTSENDWYHDRSNGKLYYYTVSANAEVIITFALFFKTGDPEPFHADINDSNTELVFYEGRMKETSFFQSIEDISNGTLSIASSNISLINNDSYYNGFANDNVSFKNALLKVYMFYNVITNNALVFYGNVETAAFNSDELLLEVKDRNKQLQSIPKFTDVDSEYKITTDRFGTDISSEIVGNVIPFCLGRATSFKYSKIKQTLKYKQITESISDAVVSNPTDNIYYQDVYEANDVIDDGSIALKVIERENVTTGFPPASVRCAKFVAFRSINQLISKFYLIITYANIVDKRSDAATSTEFGGDIVVPVSSLDKLFIGQSVSIDYDTSPSTGLGYGARISDIDFDNSKVTVTPSGNVKIRKNTLSLTYTMLTVNPFRAVYFDSGIPVGVTDETSSYNEANADGTYTTFFRIDRYAGVYDLGYLDQYYYIGSDAKLLIRGGVIDQYTELNSSTIELKDIPFFIQAMTSNTNMSLGSILHFTLKKAGFETDGGSGLTLTESTSSFKDIDTKLGTTYFTLKSTDGETYLDLLQKMLSSIFGFLYIQDDGKYGVRLFEQTTYNETSWALSEDDIVVGSISSEFDCSDIATRLKSSCDVIRWNPLEYKSDSKILLHGDIEKQEEFFIEDPIVYETKVRNRKFAYLSNPIRKFRFIVINEGYNILIGDKIIVQFPLSNKWLGSNKVYTLFVIAVNKSLIGTEVTAIENIFPSL